MRPGGYNQQRAHHPDYSIALAITILLAIGLVMMYSISPILSQKLVGNVDRNYYFLQQLKWIGIGLVVWIATTSISYNSWRKLAPVAMVLSLASMLLLLVPGLSNSSHGATRWLALGPFQFQPAEVLKVAAIMYLATWLEHRREELKSLGDSVAPFMIMVFVASFIIVVFQRDMGTAMVLALASVGMYFTAGLKWTHLGSVMAAGLLAGWFAILAFPHRMERFTTFLHPDKDTTGQGYHITQALIAIGSGGLMGVGLGHSIQVYGYLPEAANDSIFAVIAEEFGLIGSLVIVVLFGFLVFRGLQVARQAPDMLARLMATGISLWLLFQAFINIGAMLSLVPLTGIPLPFISYGGTSLVISLFGAGILLNISKYTVREVSDADHRQRRGDSRAYIADTGHQRRVKTTG